MLRTKKVLSRAGVLSLALLGGAGCSTVLPYESEFACKTQDYGKCIHPENAYREAIEATEANAGAIGAVDDGRAKRGKQARTTLASASTGYDGYRQAVYTELAAMIEAPVTPMVAPAKTIRTLILPYADDAREQRLYMPRYVYSVLEPPKFVLGDYLNVETRDFAGALAEGLLIAPSATPVRAGAKDESGAAPRLKPAAANSEN